MVKERKFRGWYMVGAVHLLLAVIFGAAYSFGAFFTALQTNFDAGRFSTASIFSLTALIYYAVGVFSGAWSDRTSVRTVTGIGILLLSLGFFGSSLLASSLTAFLLTFCLLVGVGVGLVYVPAVSTIQRWFVVHRSSASGLALAGTGLGTLVGPMVAGGLMRHLSWQSTLQVYAVAIAVLGLAAAFILRGRPEDVGEYPDGLRPVEVTSMQRPGFSGSVTLREAAGRAQFWWFFYRDIFRLYRTVPGVGSYQSLCAATGAACNTSQSAHRFDRRGQYRRPSGFGTNRRPSGRAAFFWLSSR